MIVYFIGKNFTKFIILMFLCKQLVTCKDLKTLFKSFKMLCQFLSCFNFYVLHLSKLLEISIVENFLSH